MWVILGNQNLIAVHSNRDGSTIISYLVHLQSKVSLVIFLSIDNLQCLYFFRSNFYFNKVLNTYLLFACIRFHISLTFLRLQGCLVLCLVVLNHMVTFILGVKQQACRYATFTRSVFGFVEMCPASVVKATKMVSLIGKFRSVKPIGKSNYLVFSHALKTEVVISSFCKVLSRFL